MWHTPPLRRLGIVFAPVYSFARHGVGKIPGPRTIGPAGMTGVDFESRADVATLEQRAVSLRAQADNLEHAYQRATWVRFVLVFFPVPFVVVLLRLQIDAWMYYVFGGLIILSG